jgi:sulfur carrier protein ThiS
MPVVLIPAPYRGPTKGISEVEVPVGTILSCIEKVEELHPGFMPLVIDANGAVQRFVKLYINQAPIEAEGFATVEVAEDDRLEVLAAVAGG